MKHKYEGKDLQSLVELGREQGYLTFDQVNDFLPVPLQNFVRVTTRQNYVSATPDVGVAHAYLARIAVRARGSRFA
jgi:Sigma-70 factor, region 1.1